MRVPSSGMVLFHRGPPMHGVQHPKGFAIVCCASSLLSCMILARCPSVCFACELVSASLSCPACAPTCHDGLGNGLRGIVLKML